MTTHETPHYLAIAARFGLDRDAIERGETIRKMVSIASLDEFKAIFGGSLTDEQRDRHSAEQRPVPERADGAALLLDELSRHIFGRHTPSAEARAYAETIFPIAAKIISAKNLIISSDESYGPSHAPVMISCEKLTFSGGSITAITTVLHLVAGELDITNAGLAAYHIGVLGEHGDNGEPGDNGTPHSGPAKAGKKSKPAIPGTCLDPGGAGENGLRGNDGARGEDGHDGRGAMTANIEISEFSKSCSHPFVVYTEAAAGGDGGDGGKGGKGQDGGKGGKGCDSGCTGTDGGKGGKAGEGGNGDNGGNGGRASSSMGDIWIRFPKAFESRLQTNGCSMSPGKRGEAGMAGRPGEPGKGGSGGKHAKKGKKGGENVEGKPGSPGQPGKGSGEPGKFVVSFH